jgi:poly(hydroxyalkanoate) depolymerase family esterase
VAYPSQPNAANAQACWNWFAPAHQMRERGEPAILAGLTRELMQEFGLQREQVFVAGLSAGGAMAAVMLETYPDLYSRAGIHSGLAYRSANDVMSAFAAMRGDATRVVAGVPVQSTYPARMIIFHGDADKTVHPRNARRILSERVDATWAVAKTAGEANGQTYAKEVFTQGDSLVEVWSISGAGHAWSGGDPRGSFASQSGPHASAEMARFFLS